MGGGDNLRLCGKKRGRLLTNIWEKRNSILERYECLLLLHSDFYLDFLAWVCFCMSISLTKGEGKEIVICHRLRVDIPL